MGKQGQTGSGIEYRVIVTVIKGEMCEWGKSMGYISERPKAQTRNMVIINSKRRVRNREISFLFELMNARHKFKNKIESWNGLKSWLGMICSKKAQVNKYEGSIRIYTVFSN